MQIIAGPTGLQLAEELGKSMSLRVFVPEFKTFNDGEHYIRIPFEIEDDILIIQTLSYPQDSNLFQLLNLISTIHRLKKCNAC